MKKGERGGRGRRRKKEENEKERMPMMTLDRREASFVLHPVE